MSVAKAARVSPATVSRAFNHPHLVKAPTRKRIEAAVERLGYIRNRAARTMHGRRSGTIGLIVPTMNNAIFAELTQSISEELDKDGFALLVATHGYNLRSEVALLRKFLEHRVDGIALVGLDHDDAVYTLIDRQKTPTVAVWNYDPGSNVSCIGADNFAAGQMAADHLVRLGHQRIGLALPPTDENERARSRLDGVRSVLDAAGSPIASDCQIEAVYDIAAAKTSILGLLTGPTPPTALICGNDIIAQAAIFAAQKAGLAVPRDLSVVGIGDFQGSAELEPGLTTVRIPADEIGREAGRYLSRTIAEDTPAEIVRRCFDATLVVRASTEACALMTGPAQ